MKLEKMQTILVSKIAEAMYIWEHREGLRSEAINPYEFAGTVCEKAFKQATADPFMLSIAMIAAQGILASVARSEQADIAAAAQRN